MQALEDAFDTNHDGLPGRGRRGFLRFQACMITNANGRTTVESLAQAGITSINLTPNTCHADF